MSEPITTEELLKEANGEIMRLTKRESKLKQTVKDFLAKYDIKEPLRFCLESASMVVAHNDSKTLTEFCTAPKSITTWEEPKNPLFTNPRSCEAIEL